MYTEFTITTYTWGYYSLSLKKLAKVTVYTYDHQSFLVGSEQESGSVITVVTPATELLFIKVPSTSCKET